MKIKTKRRGAAAVEFAIVLPILVLLVFGMIEFGRMLMVQQMIVNSAREGARHAILNGSSLQSTTARVENYLVNAGITDPEITISPDPEKVGTSEPVTVGVRVPFTDVSWLPTPMFLGQKSLESQSVMFHE